MDYSEKKDITTQTSSEGDVISADKKNFPRDEKDYADVEVLKSEPTRPLETAEDIVTNVIHVDDDPSMNPWTVRMFVVGKSSTDQLAG
jgi:hypothetical protein